MEKEINKLKVQFSKAKTEKEKDIIRAKMQQLKNKDEDAYINGLVKSLEDTHQKVKSLNQRIKVREQLSDIIEILPLSYIAKVYFGKSRHWLYHRINGNIINGKQAKFTENEVETLNFALQDISKKIGSTNVA